MHLRLCRCAKPRAGGRLQPAAEIPYVGVRPAYYRESVRRGRQTPRASSLEPQASSLAPGPPCVSQWPLSEDLPLPSSRTLHRSPVLCDFGHRQEVIRSPCQAALVTVERARGAMGTKGHQPLRWEACQPCACVYISFSVRQALRNMPRNDPESHRGWPDGPLRRSTSRPGKRHICQIDTSFPCISNNFLAPTEYPRDLGEVMPEIQTNREPGRCCIPDRGLLTANTPSHLSQPNQVRHGSEQFCHF
jgi:hypothetical protein